MHYNVSFFHLYLKNGGSVPDTTAWRVVVEKPQSVAPHDVSGRSRNFADDTLELDGAACFVNLLFDDPTMIVHHLHAGHCKFFFFSKINKLFYRLLNMYNLLHFSLSPHVGCSLFICSLQTFGLVCKLVLGNWPWVYWVVWAILTFLIH